MENEANAAFTKPTKFRFKNRSKEETTQIFKGKDKESTQQATHVYLTQFKRFLNVKSLPQVEDIPTKDLDGILFEFYNSIQPQKKDDYCIQTLKCIRAGLNRYFRKERGIDIAKDSMFVRANEMLKAVQVDAKKKGLGVKNPTPQSLKSISNVLRSTFAMTMLLFQTPNVYNRTLSSTLSTFFVVVAERIYMT